MLIPAFLLTDFCPLFLPGGCLPTFHCSVGQLGLYLVPQFLSGPYHFIVHHVRYFSPGQLVSVPGLVVVVLLDVEVEVVPALAKRSGLVPAFMGFFLFHIRTLLQVWCNCVMLGFFPFWSPEVKSSGWYFTVVISAAHSITSLGIGSLVKTSV